MSQESYDEAASRGRKLMRKQNFPDAIEAFRMAVTLEPDNPEAHNSLATACYMGNEFEEAARLRDEIKRLEAVDLGIEDAQPIGPKRLAARIRAADAKSRSKRQKSTYRTKGQRKNDSTKRRRH